MNKRINSGISAILAVSLIFSGCSTQSGGTGKSGAAVTLNTVSMFGEGDSANAAYIGLIADFMQQNTNITVNDSSSMSNEEWKKSVMDSFLEDETTPDVLFYFTGADVRRMILNDQLVSAEEIRQQYPDYGTNIRQSTMQFMKEFDGNHYAIPVKGFWEGLFCNKDLFEQYGAPLPTDWQSFTKAIEIFRANGIVPVAASLKEVPHYWIEHLVLSQAGAVEHRLNPKDYVPQSWVDGIGQFTTLYNMSAFPSDTNNMGNEAATALFLEKKAAMILDGSWFVQSISDPQNTVVLPFPTMPNGNGTQGDIISGFSSGYYITRKAWNDPQKRDTAVAFVMHMTNEKSIATMCEMGGAPAMDIEQGSGTSPLQQSAVDLQQNAQNACMPIDSRLYKDAWQYLCSAISDTASGRISAEEVVLELSKRNQW